MNIKKEISEAIIPCIMLSIPLMIGILIAFVFEQVVKRLPGYPWIELNWLLILGLCAAFVVGIAFGIWIDDDREYPAEW